MEFFDVVVVGAGMAGVTLAHALTEPAERAYPAVPKVAIVDPKTQYPHAFKAEKIELDQAILMRRLGIFDWMLPGAGVIETVHDARGGRVQQTVTVEQYGLAYDDMVNRVRSRLQSRVDVRVGKVNAAQLGDDEQLLTLNDGTSLRARLVAFASGTQALEGLGLPVRHDHLDKEFSFAFGFDVARTDGSPFTFDSVSYYPDGTSTRVAYLTLFPIGQTMRANLFTYHEPKDPWVGRFFDAPVETLLQAMPKLFDVTGSFAVVGKIHGQPIALYDNGDRPRVGAVLVGDAFQSVCPTTGTGLSKVLTDVDVLANDCIRSWLRTSGMGSSKISQYYDHPRKRLVDKGSWDRAQYRKKFSLDASLRWKAHRELAYVEMRATRLGERAVTAAKSLGGLRSRRA
jgi:2-polyprenyl-6-methoxyphenol hydroxylase-like FAD-dependent oxidoreductase